MPLGDEVNAPPPSGEDASEPDLRVWTLDSELGYQRVIQGAGSVAAPLLAGFSFTLLVLVLQSLQVKSETVTIGAHSSVIRDTEPLCRVPELAGILLLLAGILFVFSVQAALSARSHAHTPAELEEWYPEHFRPDGGAPDAETRRRLEWSTLEAPAIQVGNKWYGGWVRGFQRREIAEANTWGERTRLLYHGGIIFLLSGVMLLTTPPGDGSPWRWALTAVAAVGTLLEIIWIARNYECPARRASSLVRFFRSQR